MQETQTEGRPPTPSQISIGGAPTPPDPRSASTPAFQPTLGPKDAATLTVGALLSLLWTLAVDHGGFSLVLICNGGVGFSLSILAFFACSLALRGGLRGLGRQTVVLLVAVALLACVPSVVSSKELRFLNSLVLGCACCLEYLLLSGCSESVALSLSGFACSVGRFFCEQFANMRFAFALRSRGNAGQLRSVGWGTLAALLVLMVVLPLLTSADPVFASVIRDWLSWLDDGLEVWAVRIVRFVLLTLMSFSLLFAVVHHKGSTLTVGHSNPLRANSLAVSVALGILDAIYLIFVVIQCTYLFGGASSPVMYGGYAEYARTGFFQLVAVAAINLAVVLVTIMARRDAEPSKTVISLQLVLVVVILVMLASAALRMGLYVGRYGLTMSRALTYVGMVSIFTLSVLAVARILRSSVPYFRWGLTALLAIWLAFTLSIPDARIAWFNVDGYLNGSIERIDPYYLGSLSIDAAPALKKLIKESPADALQAQEALNYAERQSSGDWASYSVGELMGLHHVPGPTTGSRTELIPDQS